MQADVLFKEPPPLRTPLLISLLKEQDQVD